MESRVSEIAFKTFNHSSEKVIAENRIGRNYFVLTRLISQDILYNTYETMVYYMPHSEEKRQFISKITRVCAEANEAKILHEQGIRIAKILSKSRTKRFTQ